MKGQAIFTVLIIFLFLQFFSVAINTYYSLVSLLPKLNINHIVICYICFCLGFSAGCIKPPFVCLISFSFSNLFLSSRAHVHKQAITRLEKHHCLHTLLLLLPSVSINMSEWAVKHASFGYAALNTSVIWEEIGIFTCCVCFNDIKQSNMVNMPDFSNASLENFKR